MRYRRRACAADFCRFAFAQGYPGTNTILLPQDADHAPHRPWLDIDMDFSVGFDHGMPARRAATICKRLGVGIAAAVSLWRGFGWTVCDCGAQASYGLADLMHYPVAIREGF